ncbi:MAG: DNA topoisomerase IV [Flavobacteriaceae bacterium]|nr:DNA topoisomerase IV [Flavobacteriaceae bacterium]
MKKHRLFILTIMLSGCYGVERNCNEFQTGSYSSEITIDEQTFISSFVRSDSLQIETFDGKTDSSSVRWINECEVIFRTINPKSNLEKKDIHLKILTTTKSSYTFEYSYVGESKKQKGIATKTN